MTDRIVDRVVAVDLDELDGKTPDELIAAIAAAVNEVPAEYRSVALVSAETGWGENERGRLELRWTSPETEDERVTRERRSLGYHQDYERRERAELARLTAKYGSPS